MRPSEILRWTSVRWGMAVAVFLASGAALVFMLDYRLATSGVLWTVDRSVLEQLTLLSERPPELLPFMISSRLQHQPRVITRVGLFDSRRQLIVGDIDVLPNRIRLDGKIELRALAEGLHKTRRLARIAGLPLSNGRILVVARNLDDVPDLRESFMLALLAGIVPAMAISIAGGVLVGVRTQRRLVRMRDHAERIIAGQLELRLPVSASGDGLDQLATTVNCILEHTQELVGALKGVGEDIAHDLRTPLTWTRARLERALAQAPDDGHVKAMIEQTIGGLDQALLTISSLLRIAEIEQVRRRSAFAPCDLAQIAHETAENYRPVAEDKRVLVSVDARSTAPVNGDHDLLVEAIVNLVDNAVKFAPFGGNVAISVSDDDCGPLLRVADDGPGIAEEERALVLRRFYRSDKSRTTNGSGLGLNLVAAVAKLHGFSLTIGDNNPGCVVELRCTYLEENTAGAEQQPPAIVLS